jgi:hypothetical protein
MGSSTIPSVTYEIHPGASLDEAPYISGFECLVQGEKYGRPICDYYKAVTSSPLIISQTSEEICFKKVMPVSIPRDYKAETLYRIIVETELGSKGGYYEGATFARILSLPADLPEGETTLWYETTTVALYSCDVSYDEKSNALGVEHKTDRTAETDRIERLSKTHNIPILDNELSELVRLHKEKKKLQSEMQVALVKMIMSGDISPAALGGGGQLSNEMIDKFPKEGLVRISDIIQRIEAIAAPFEAAEKSDIVREEMTKLSETSGVPISFDKIEETIALIAEKDRIQKRIALVARRKWEAEGGPLNAVQKPLPNAEDDIRFKEIEARLKAIYAPMIETK